MMDWTRQIRIWELESERDLLEKKIEILLGLLDNDQIEIAAKLYQEWIATEFARIIKEVNQCNLTT